MIKITNERGARVGYNPFISNKGEWNDCFSTFSIRVLPPIFISTILQSVRKENLAHYFPYDVKLLLLAHSLSFLVNQKARNAIVGAENLLKADKPRGKLAEHEKNLETMSRRRVVYEFFECSTNIPSGLSAYNPQKLVVYCFYITIQKTR